MKKMVQQKKQAVYGGMAPKNGIEWIESKPWLWDFHITPFKPTPKKTIFSILVFVIAFILLSQLNIKDQNFQLYSSAAFAAVTYFLLSRWQAMERAKEQREKNPPPSGPMRKYIAAIIAVGVILPILLFFDCQKTNQVGLWRKIAVGQNYFFNSCETASLSVIIFFAALICIIIYNYRKTLFKQGQ